MAEDRTSVDIEAAYCSHADELIRYATALVGPARAADVVTDAFLKVSARSCHGDIEHLRAYLFRSVYHRAIDVNRSRDRRHEREARDWRERVRLVDSDGADASQAGIDARRAMAATLSDQQRAVVFLTYWCDLPPGEVAERLGVRTGTVKKQLARARAKLKEVLDV